MAVPFLLRRPFAPPLLLAGWLALGAGCAHAPKPAAEHQPERYLRVEAAADQTRSLQVAARRFVSSKKRAPIVWLVGASHLGEPNYFAAIQELLDAQSLVLFEGVGGAPSRSEKVTPENESLQETMARSVGLVFQLDAVDYERPHFRNSDLTVGQVRSVFTRPEYREGMEDFDDLVGVMSGGTFWGRVAGWALSWLGQNPRTRAVVRLAMIELLGSVKGDMTQMGGVPPGMQKLLEVLIRERNQVVIQDLTRELSQQSPPRSLAVFYGAAHMDDLEKRLVRDLGYRPVESRWLTAFAVNPAAAGLSRSEMETIRALVQWQLDGMQPAKP